MCPATWPISLPNLFLTVFIILILRNSAGAMLSSLAVVLQPSISWRNYMTLEPKYNWLLVASPLNSTANPRWANRALGGSEFAIHNRGLVQVWSRRFPVAPRLYSDIFLKTFVSKSSVGTWARQLLGSQEIAFWVECLFNLDLPQKTPRSAMVRFTWFFAMQTALDA